MVNRDQFDCRLALWRSGRGLAAPQRPRLDAEIDGAKVSCGCPLAIMAILPTRFAPLVRFSLVHDAGDVISRVRLVLRRAADRRESPRLTWKEARTLDPCQNRRWRVRAG